MWIYSFTRSPHHPHGQRVERGREHAIFPSMTALTIGVVEAFREIDAGTLTTKADLREVERSLRLLAADGEAPRSHAFRVGRHDAAAGPSKRSSKGGAAAKAGSSSSAKSERH
jgi:hypothetical protein